MGKLTASLRKYIAALREPRTAVRIARALWLVWAIILWNVVFDHAIEAAGKRYVTAATVAATRPRRYARMDQWMRPAVTRGLWMATAVSGRTLAAGLGLIAAAKNRGLAD